MRRVVITGMGAIASTGLNVNEFWDSMKNGRHGISPIEGFDTANCDVKVAAEAKNYDPLNYFDKRELRRTDRFNQFALVAADEAMKDCGTDFADLDPYRVGVIVGSGIGGFHSIENEYRKFMEKGGKRVSVFFVPMMIINMAAGSISMKYHFKGINYAPVSACATSAHAVGEAFHAIKNGYLDACVTGGSEAAIIEFSVAGFDNMKALSTRRIRRARPFRLTRTATALLWARAARFWCWRNMNTQRRAGAKIYAEVVGYGATGDAYHMTSPDPEGEGAAHAMSTACEEAGIRPEEVGYINAHGTSTGFKR